MRSPIKRNVAKREPPAHVTVTKTIRRPWRTAGLAAITERILGKHYTLSIVLIGDTLAKNLNRTHRNKQTAANVLTFPINTHTGEVFLNVARIKREAHRFGLSPQGHTRFLLIHACLHLKGYTHGSTMEQAEKRFMKEFDLR